MHQLSLPINFDEESIRENSAIPFEEIWELFPYRPCNTFRSVRVCHADCGDCFIGLAEFPTSEI